MTQPKTSHVSFTFVNYRLEMDRASNNFKGVTPVKLSGETYFCSDKHRLRLIAIKVPSPPLSCYCYFHTLVLTLRGYSSYLMFTKPTVTISSNSHKLIYVVDLVNDKLKMWCNNCRKFYDYYE